MLLGTTDLALVGCVSVNTTGLRLALRRSLMRSAVAATSTAKYPRGGKVTAMDDFVKSSHSGEVNNYIKPGRRTKHSINPHKRVFSSYVKCFQDHKAACMLDNVGFCLGDIQTDTPHTMEKRCLSCQYKSF